MATGFSTTGFCRSDFCDNIFCLSKGFIKFRSLDEFCRFCFCSGCYFLFFRYDFLARYVFCKIDKMGFCKSGILKNE